MEAMQHLGKVIEGWEVVEQITALPIEKVDIGIPGVDVNEPIEPEYMEKVIVEHGESNMMSRLF